MKLYNLLEEVILEEIGKQQLLTEGVSDDDIINAINSGKAVNILYRDYDNQPPSKRYVLVMVYGQLKNGNYAIRAQQISGASKRGNTNAATKLFRVDRIEGWYPTNMVINSPVDNYNPNGDKKFDLATSSVQDSFQRIIAQAKPKNKPEMVQTNNDLNKI